MGKRDTNQEFIKPSILFHAVSKQMPLDNWTLDSQVGLSGNFLPLLLLPSNQCTVQRYVASELWKLHTAITTNRPLLRRKITKAGMKALAINF